MHRIFSFVIVLGFAGAVVACSTSRAAIDKEHYADYVAAVAILDSRDRGRLGEAHRMLDTVVRHDGKYAPVYAAMARYTLLKGEALAPQINPEAWMREFVLPKSERYLQRALSIDPESPEALALYVHVAHRMQNPALEHAMARRALAAGACPSGCRS